MCFAERQTKGEKQQQVLQSASIDLFIVTGNTPLPKGGITNVSHLNFFFRSKSLASRPRNCANLPLLYTRRSSHRPVGWDCIVVTLNNREHVGPVMHSTLTVQGTKLFKQKNLAKTGLRLSPQTTYLSPKNLHPSVAE